MQNSAAEASNVESQLLEVDDASPKSTLDDSVDISFDTAYHKRVMEDLDALLADLQNTTAHITSYQSTHLQQPQQGKREYCPQKLSQELQQSVPKPSPVGEGHQYMDFISSTDNETYNHQQTHSSSGSPGFGTDQVGMSAHVQGHSLKTDNFEGSPARGSSQSGGLHSGSSTPPPLPPPPPLDDIEVTSNSRDFEQPIYEEQTFQMRETTPMHINESGDHQVVTQKNPARISDREQRMSSLSNNLSELDQLLQDLNSAQFLAEVDRKSSNAGELTAMNGSAGKKPPPVAPKPSGKPVPRTSGENMLDQPGRVAGDLNYEDLDTVAANHNGLESSAAHGTSFSTSSNLQAASVATMELDELMMSLSEFKKKGDGASEGNEPAYAKPVKSQTASHSTTPTSLHELGVAQHMVPEQRQTSQHSHVQQVPRENGLEVMLGDLQSDLNRQEVNIKQKGVCAACQKPIVGQVTAALGRTWHVEHFVCAHCEEPLGTRNFYERDSLAYCEEDYCQLFAPRCAYCNGPIIDKCITALEKMWHPEHFFCAQCGQPFGDDDFHEKNGKAYCRNDYFQMFATKCGGCAHPILENYISALNRQWHPECFVCWECRSHFGSGSFFDYEGLPYCETHYHARKGSLCASCEKPITGRCITAMFRKFHPEHFVCAFCLKQLNKGTFKEQNDKPYCHPCFVKLFG